MPRFIRDDGTITIRCITPGQGRSAYYEEEVLMRDSVRACSGALLHFDHATESERLQRPERSVRDLFGRVVSTPRYLKNGPEGPGTYVEGYVLKPHRPLVEELAKIGGWSIHMPGRKAVKKINGKDTVVAAELWEGPLNSIDLVTKGARGGAAVPFAESLVEGWLKESASGDPHTFIEYAMESERREEREAMELKEALDRITALEAEKATLTTQNQALVDTNQRLVEAVALRDGKVLVEAQVAKDAAKLPDVTRARLVEACVRAIPVKDGTLDQATLTAFVAESIRVEAEYVEKITDAAKPSSGISGMGNKGSVSGDSLKESLVQSYTRSGMSKERATQLAEVAAQGR